MDYTPKGFKLPADGSGAWPGNDDYPPYLFDDDIAVAVDVALATRRPLLVAGPPGGGKSTLAPAIAGLLDWRFLRHTLTSRSRLEELTGEIDQLRRLHDAQAATPDHPLPPDWFYRKPGLLWWAFAPAQARRRGATEAEIEPFKNAFVPPEQPTGFNPDTANAVLLLDEIDKAEPDLPNDLLEPLDRKRFQVPAGPEVRAPADLHTLVMITTNGERELPQAFLRRCVSLVLKEPDKTFLIAVARHHFGILAPTAEPPIFAAVADQVLDLAKHARERNLRAPSTSEYLDALRACQALGIDPDHPLWSRVQRATMQKESAGNAATGADW